ncbi:DUF6114 domain-containing protein [Streptomyces sp. GC420]|uniref:DUF6114 domain-containing protein n=1 Tax=Streptomyces sp. GC420 TaxID=2697568 RepID=UPI001414E8A8|nr:DUF6114 domain-containing protein [Streptomyces sp. GC420]NBM19110.1 hypothetical protein [Streptomyces sp. GC420]
MSAESPVTRGFHYWRLRFRGWRGTRPFWAGLFTMLGGLPIAYLPYANLKLGHMSMTVATTAGSGSLIIGVLLVTLGLTMWFHSIVRVFAGVAAILLGLVSLPVSNFGGFFIGFLLAVVGGGLSIAWAPGVPPAADTAEPFEKTPQGDAPEGDGLGGLPYEDGSYSSHGEDAPEAAQGGEPDDAKASVAAGPTVDVNGGRNSAG